MRVEGVRVMPARPDRVGVGPKVDGARDRAGVVQSSVPRWLRPIVLINVIEGVQNAVEQLSEFVGGHEAVLVRSPGVTRGARLRTRLDAPVDLRFGHANGPRVGFGRLTTGFVSPRIAEDSVSEDDEGLLV